MAEQSLALGINLVEGEEASGKTALCLWWTLRIVKERGKALWLISEDIGAAAGFLGGASCVAVQGRRISTIMQVAHEILESQWDLVVLDSLTACLPDHPDARVIASSVSKSLRGLVWDRSFLIVSQLRYPRSPGGSMFHALVKRRFGLERISQGETLVSEIKVDGELMESKLVWPIGKPPEIRALDEREQVRYYGGRLRVGRGRVQEHPGPDRATVSDSGSAGGRADQVQQYGSDSE